MIGIRSADGFWSNPIGPAVRELSERVRPVERPRLRFKDICNRDMKLADVDINTWECIADDRIIVRGGIQNADDTKNKMFIFDLKKDRN